MNNPKAKKTALFIAIAAFTGVSFLVIGADMAWGSWAIRNVLGVAMLLAGFAVIVIVSIYATIKIIDYIEDI